MLSALAAELEALDVVEFDTSIAPAARHMQRRLLRCLLAANVPRIRQRRLLGRGEDAEVLLVALHPDLERAPYGRDFLLLSRYTPL